MKYEIEAAAEFITRLLFPNISPTTSPRSYPTLPTQPSATSPRKFTIGLNNKEREEREEEESSNLFYKKMCKELGKKFVGHWYEDAPIKGQAYRSLLVDSENNFIDKVILSSAQKSNIRNVETRLKKTHGFQMWIDPGEVEVEYLPSSLKSRKSNEIIYSTRRNISTRPPTPPSPSSSPSLSSPPSSPVPSSYILSSPSSSSPSLQFSSSPSLAHSIPLNSANVYRANKPIRISRQNDEPVLFTKSFFPIDKDVNNTSTIDDDSITSPALSIPQRAM